MTCRRRTESLLKNWLITWPVFFSNLAVVGVGLAVFKEEDATYSIIVAFCALFLGALITYFAKR